MGSKSRRRSRSKSRSRSRDRRVKSRGNRSQSPEERRGRSRSADTKKAARGRGRSGSRGSSDGAPARRRPQHRGRSGSSSGSENDRRREPRRQRSISRGRSSSSDLDDPKMRGRREEVENRRGTSRERTRGRSQSSSGSRDGGSDRDRRRRRSPDRGSPVRDWRRKERDREREKWKSNSRDREKKETETKAESKGRSEERERGRSDRSRENNSYRGRQRSSSPDSSDSSGSDNEGRVVKEKEERKKQKEMMKALETPEEKRARRLAKKEAKEKKRREKMGWSEEYMGYTNADNPFGDNNLLGTFKWQKALDKKGIGHLGEKELKERNKCIQEENRRELQKVKQLRLEREREKAMRETELEMLQREKEAEHFKTWAEQEDNFHLHQAKLRSKIRIRDGRAKPIDLLAKYISAEDDDLAVEMHEPYTFLNGLTVTDMDDLLEDIKVYMELEQGKNVDFWRDMTTITEDEISKLRKLEASGKGPGDRREGINTAVSTDVQTVFKGKTYSQLQALHLNIESKIRAGGSNLDIGYWESLLQQVRVYMARARLRERHQDVLRQKLFKLKQEQGVESEPLFPIIKEEPRTEEDEERTGGPSRELTTEEPSVSSSSRNRNRDAEEDEEEPGTSGAGSRDEDGGEKDEGKDDEEKGEVVEAVLTEEDLIQQSQAEYDSGRYSPALLTPSELPLDTHTITPEEDTHRLQLARRQLQVTGDAKESAEDAFVRRAKEGMGNDEAQFSVEFPVTGKMYLWADKYRPRKPRFFNRVHTGFEWNKYNQTHYDFDNPPPKIVQGYKFNIFYPDLIDKRSTPQYFLEPSPDNKDFGILRFHAGPPYEDIAFKIVNREWEYSHRHGFRCQFANGIFQLWFHFKRYRYRR
ncbi:LOW QUALITY PROTEIN: splicing factor Cactin [Acanthochromis polyacanthus]|uniref:LOW QUALITY PROTEIN: splicing factor Cactin n=1 Tax=Acanthochromis polyacanthus TaxID=80966 RepID=UPI002234E803|nr:LOW QUALITY PROTEIN: splicing factor Cactin [Acanthochromis polyacanthus]